MGVIDLLEMVNIHHQQGQWLAITGHTLQLCTRGFDEIVTIFQPRQAVRLQLLLQLVDQFAVALTQHQRFRGAGMNFHAHHQHQRQIKAAQRHQSQAEQRAVQQRRSQQRQRWSNQVGQQQLAVWVAHHNRQRNQPYMHQHHKHQAVEIARHVSPHHNRRPNRHVRTMGQCNAAYPVLFVLHIGCGTLEAQVHQGVSDNRQQCQCQPNTSLPHRNP